MTRPTQKKCKRCNHVFSFHRAGKSRCCVTNCKCTKWVEPQARSEDDRSES